MYHCMLKLNIQGDKSYKLDYHTSKFSTNMYVKLYAKLLMMLQLNKLNNTHGPCDGCSCLKISWCTSHRVERVTFFLTPLIWVRMYYLFIHVHLVKNFCLMDRDMDLSF